MSSLLALIVATAVLVVIPGPNVALIVANSLRYGFRMGVVTVLGTTAGLALQLALVVIGMAAVIELAAETLSWIRWAGVAYLVALGIRTWREPADDLTSVEPAPAVFWRGCLLAAINPKTLLFNAAFIPQFVANGSASVAHVVLVATAFLIVVFLGDVLWAAFANSARRVLGRYSTWRNRLTGAFLTAAGIGLALARR
jgi:threonine/homoserine/homoserine lactone efflux protein